MLGSRQGSTEYCKYIWSGLLIACSLWVSILCGANSLAVYAPGLQLYRCRCSGSPCKTLWCCSSMVKLSLWEVLPACSLGSLCGLSWQGLTMMPKNNSQKLHLAIRDAATKEVAGFPQRWSPVWQVVLCSLAADDNVRVENRYSYLFIGLEKLKSCEMCSFKEFRSSLVLRPAGLASKCSE